MVKSPWWATLTTVLAVIAGLLGSVYQGDVANAFPLVWSGPWGQISGRALAFWICVVLFALLFFIRQLADDQARTRLEQAATKSEASTARIEALVQTLPPRAFQTQLAEMYVTTHDAIASVLPHRVREGVGADDLVSVTRSLLHSIANLAAMYDDQPVTDRGAAIYSANVMLFVPRATGGRPFPEHLRMLFLPEEYDLGRLKGALLLRQDLSSTSTREAIDDEVPAIALPVPEVADREGRWVALPGAPRAFLRWEADGYADTETIADWAREKGDFTPSVAVALHRYFADGDGRGIRSFISRPVGVGADGNPLGVLNIHSNRPNLLGPNVEKRQIFQALVTPILVELADALQCLVKVEEHESATRIAQAAPPTVHLQAES